MGFLKLFRVFLFILYFFIRVPSSLQHLSIQRARHQEGFIYHFQLGVCDAFRNLQENLPIVAKGSVYLVWSLKV